MACTKETVKRSGLNIWSGETKSEARSAPVVDIIAVQGLGADPFYTWVKKVPAEGVNESRRVRDTVQFWKAKKRHDKDRNDGFTEVMWVRDLLLPLFRDARIATYSYESDWRDPSVKTSLRQCAEQFLNILSQNRQHETERRRPIVLIGHSLGCLVIQQALVTAVHQQKFDDFRLSIGGIVFLGAPFQGCDAAFFGKWLARLAGRDSTLLKSLEKGDIGLRHLSEDFWGSYSDWDLVCFYENIEAEYRLFKAKIVSSQSATLPEKRMMFLNTDHSGLNKFSGENDENFALLLPEIRRMVESGSTIAADRHRRKDIAGTGHGIEFSVSFDLTGIPATAAFLGRRSDLDLLKEQLKPGEECDRRRICVLHGLGGIGKTQLAIEYARVHKGAYTSFFWLDGKTEESLIRGLVSIGARLPKGQISEIGVEDFKGLENSKRAEEVLQWFGRSGNTQWLLIYDNIDKTSYGEETTDHNSDVYDITKYLPKGDAGSVIITTRLQRLRSLGNQVHLHPLSVGDSLIILEKQAGRSLKQIVPTDTADIGRWDPDAVSLVERLGYLPLALVLAGSYISRTTVVEYRELYDESWERLHYKMRRTDYPERTIITTWQISYDDLKNKSEEAARLLQLWGYLDNQELWLELLQWPGHEKSAPEWLQKITADKFNFRETIDMLCNYSLVESNENSETYSIHLVLQDWIRESVKDNEDEDILWTAVITVGLAVPNNDERDSAISQRRILPHAVQALKYWSRISCFEPYLNDACLAGLNGLGDLYADQDRTAEAEQIYQRALAGCEKTLGPEHTATLDTVNSLGILYRKQDRLAEAEQMYKRALEGYEKALGPEHTLTLRTVNSLGILYWRQDRLAEAEQMYKRALEGYEKALGPEHTSTLRTVNNLGILYRKQDRLAEAEQMYKRALEGYEKALGPEHTSTLRTVNNLGILYMVEDRLAEAEQMYKRALEGYEKALGPEHTLTLDIVYNLGILYKKQDRLAEAEQMYKRALEGCEKALGPEHTSTLRTVNNLGILYEKQGRLAESEQTYKRALEGYEKALGPEHTSTLRTVNNLRILYEKQGRLAESEQMRQRAHKNK